MQVDQAFHQRQADAQAALAALDRMGDLGKERKDILEHGCCDADAIVADPDQVFGLGKLHGDADAAALVGVLGGIVDQVGKYLRQAQRVGAERRLVDGECHLQRVLRPLYVRTAGLDGALQHRHQVGGFGPEFDLASVDAGDVEQVVDQARQLAYLALYQVQRLAQASAGVCLFAQPQHAERIADRRQRIAQLMRQRGQEHVLGTIRLLQRPVQAGILHRGCGAARKVAGQRQVLLAVDASGLGADEGDHPQRPAMVGERHAEVGAQAQCAQRGQLFRVLRGARQDVVAHVAYNFGAAGAQHVPDAVRHGWVGRQATVHGFGNVGLFLVHVRHGDPLQVTVLAQQIDHAPVRESRHRQFGQALEGRLNIDHGGEFRAGLSQEAQVLLGALALRDVHADAEKLGASALVVEQGAGARLQPAHLAAVAHDPVFNLQVAAVAQGLFHDPAEQRAVFTMHMLQITAQRVCGRALLGREAM